MAKITNRTRIPLGLQHLKPVKKMTPEQVASDPDIRELKNRYARKRGFTSYEELETNQS